MRILFLSLIIIACSCNAGEKKKTEIQSSQAPSDTVTNGQTSSAVQTLGIKKISLAELPKTLKFRGKMEEAWQWKDKLGENILITSQVDEYKGKNDDGEETRTAELHAYHFIKTDTAYKLRWQLVDGAYNCPFDITNEFFPGAFTVTDLNNDGIAETKLQYQLSCRSDVSPNEMKLVMHEDSTKYTLRGTRWMNESKDSKCDLAINNLNLELIPKKKDEAEEYLQAMGRYENEKDFEKGNPAFIQYARSEWLKYAKQVINYDN